MKTRYALLAMALILAATLAASAWAWPNLPDNLPTHWNIRGEVDGWMPKSHALGAMAGAQVLLAVLMLALPWLSPRNFSVDGFRETFNYVFVILTAMMAGIHGVSLHAAVRPGEDSGRLILTVVFAFLALLGPALVRVRRNFWMGWRTPWTLASEEVWTATHRLAGWLMFATGILGAAAVWLGAPQAVVFVVFMVALLLPGLYSLVLYKSLERDGRMPDTPA